MTGSLRLALDVEKLVEDGYLTRDDSPENKLSFGTNKALRFGLLPDGTAHKDYACDLADPGKVGERLEPYVVGISWHGRIPVSPARDYGRYQEDPGVWALLDADPDRPNFSWLEINGKTVEQLAYLYLRIRGGKARPVEDLNWSKRQPDR